jgi:ABC-type Co2+ transport system permease subunit
MKRKARDWTLIYTPSWAGLLGVTPQCIITMTACRAVWVQQWLNAFFLFPSVVIPWAIVASLCNGHWTMMIYLYLQSTAPKHSEA